MADLFSLVSEIPIPPVLILLTKSPSYLKRFSLSILKITMYKLFLFSVSLLFVQILAHVIHPQGYPRTK